MNSEGSSGMGTMLAQRGDRRAGGHWSPGWRAVFASSVALGLGPSVILYMCFGIFAPALHQQFGWDIAAISFGGTIIAIAVMCASPIQGVLVDLFGSRPIILYSIPAFALGIAGMALMNGDIRWFYVGCALLPILGLGLWPLSFIRLVSTWFDTRLGIALGVTTAGIGIGAALMPVLIAAILAFSGWRTTYVVLGTLVLGLVWPLAAVFIREDRVGGTRNVTAALRPSSLDGIGTAAALRTGTFWLLSGSFLLLGGISSGILIHQVNILMEHGLPLRQAAYLQSALGLASIFARLATGWLLDRVRVARVMPAMLLFTAMACLVYSSSAMGWPLLACAVCFGLLIGAEFDVLGYAIRRYFGLMSFGKIFGLIFSIFQLGSAVGAAGLGLSHRSLGSYAIGLAALAAGSVVAAALLALLGTYRYQAHPAPLRAPHVRLDPNIPSPASRKY